MTVYQDILLDAPVDILPVSDEELDGGGSPKGRRFAMQAYSGGTFERPYGTCVIDLEGMAVADPEGLPIFRDHDPSKYIGRSEKLGLGIRIGNGKIDVAGSLFLGVADASEVASISDQRGKWKASVGIAIAADRVEMLGKDETADINGREIAGPCVVFRKTTLREVSFVPIGADTNTSAIALSGQHQKEASVMPAEKDESVAHERARIKSIREEFKNDTTFALEAIDNGWSKVEAKAAYADRLTAKLAAAETENAEREKAWEAKLAAASKPAKTTPAGLAEKLGSSAGSVTTEAPNDPIERWNEALAAEADRIMKLSPVAGRSVLNLTDSGHARAQAVRNLVTRDPDAYRAYLDAYNSRGLGRRRQ